MRGKCPTPHRQPGRLAIGFVILALSGAAWSGPSQPHPHDRPRESTSTTPRPEAARTEITEEEAPPPERLCPDTGRAYRHSLLITAFPRRGEASANGGGLQGMEQALPDWLARHLAHSGVTFQQQRLGASLPAASPTETAQQVRQLARDTQSQLVLTGELLDLGMANPRDLLNPDLLTRGRNAAVRGLGLNEDWDSRQRHLVLHLELLNGVTGQPVFQRAYRVRGVWDPERPDRAPFGTPAFWDTGYGQRMRHLLEEVGTELADAIRCQPLMAHLDRHVPGQPALLQAGAEQGLQAGDRLPLHRLSLRAIPGEYRQYRAYLIDSGAQLTVLRTYPNSSEVRLDAGRRLYGEHLAITSPRSEDSETPATAALEPESRSAP